MTQTRARIDREKGKKKFGFWDTLHEFVSPYFPACQVRILCQLSHPPPASFASSAAGPQLQALDRSAPAGPKQQPLDQGDPRRTSTERLVMAAGREQHLWIK